MYEVKGIKNYGTWLRIDEKCFCNDSLSLDLQRKGDLEILAYHITKPKDRFIMERTAKQLEKQIFALKLKLKAYKDALG